MRWLVSDRLTLGFLAIAAAVLVYELVLVVSVPPNNWGAPFDIQRDPALPRFYAVRAEVVP